MTIFEKSLEQFHLLNFIIFWAQNLQKKKSIICFPGKPDTDLQLFKFKVNLSSSWMEHT